jgi:hypothetical protein
MKFKPGNAGPQNRRKTVAPAPLGARKPAKGQLSTFRLELIWRKQSFSLLRTCTINRCPTTTYGE